MNRTLILVATLSLTSAVAGMAQSAVQTASATALAPANEVHSLMKTAHSSAQYKQIAEYLHQREMAYRAKADAERIEQARRSQVNAGLAQKYPRPVDSAQYLYQSYLYEAETAATQARHYEQLAGTPPDGSQQIATSSGGKS